jgi:sulfur-oxidizing protein SoxY
LNKSSNELVKYHLLYFFILKFCCFSAYAVDKQDDPLESPSWSLMHQLMLNEEPYLFDEKVIVNIPEFAEDPMNTPVSIKVKELKNIEEIIVFADLNPIQKILRFKPIDVKPYLSFRIKVEQATPVRAAVRTSDGIWHVGGRWLETAGGGCTAPSLGRFTGDWHETLMGVSSRLWSNDESNRLRFRIMHPMDTGLIAGIPEFYLQNLIVIDQTGKVIAKLDTFQPISENPVFTFDVNKNITLPIKLSGSDNNGNKLKVSIFK